MMEQAVFNLIDRNQNFEELLREATEGVDFDNGSIADNQLIPHSTHPSSPVTTQTSLQHLSIEACLSCIQAQSHITGLPMSTVAANECVKELSHLLQDHQRNDNEQQKRFAFLVLLLNKLVSEQTLSRTYFIEQLSSKVQDLPLELLWQLHACSAIRLDQYIECILDRPMVLKKFAKNFSEICSRPDEGHNERKTIKRDVLEVLVRCGYSRPVNTLELNQRLAEASQMILDDTVLDLLKLQKQCITKRDDEQSPIAHPVAELCQAVRCHPFLDKDIISRFTLRQLRNILCSHPEEFQVTEAIAKQHGEWTYSKAPQSMTSMFTQLLLANTDKQIYTVLQQALQDDAAKVNWHHTLVLVSVFCLCCKEGSSLINGLVSSLLSESFESCRVSYLYTAFLLARQASAERSCDFPSYNQWFKNQFATGSSPYLVSTKTVTFFMDFLNSLVPHEPVHYLKTHYQHRPSVPPKCQELITDYVALARTRIADFGDIPQAGSCGGPSMGQTSQTENQEAAEDVERSVTAFEKTGLIPQKVLQLRTFRHPYYMRQFLPTLLSTRMLPEIPDSKMNLIDALKSAGKIPLPMYQKYTDACKQELNMLLEGVSTEDMDDMTFDPMDRLTECLDALPQQLMAVDVTEASNYAEIVEKLSLIPGKVSAVLEDLAPRDSQNPSMDFIVIDILEMNSIMPILMKVTDLLLGCYCKTYTLLVSSQRPYTALTEQFSSLLATQGSLHHPLYHRLFTLICHQGDSLSEGHVRSLASLLVHMSALGKMLPHVKLQTHHSKLKEGEEPDHFTLLNLITRELQHRSGPAMELTLRFCTAVLESFPGDLKAKRDDIVPLSLKQKFCYLQPRLHPETRTEFISALGPQRGSLPTNMAENAGTSSSQSESWSSFGFKDCVPRKQQLDLDEWLKVELRVHSCQDCLTESQRKNYHHWMLYHCHLPQLIQSSEGQNPSSAYRTACAKILHAVLDNHSEPSGRSVQPCPHGVRQGQPGGESGRMGCGLGRDLIQILQELLLVWSTILQEGTASPSEDGGCSWLLGEWETRLKNLSGQGTGLAMALEVSNQMMVMQSLQPHLLFVDCLWQIPSQSAIKHLTSYINTHLKEYVQDGFCSFPFEVVTVIFQGAMQLYTQAQRSGASDGRVNEVVSAIEGLLVECPLFTVSFLSHWDVLSHQTNPFLILNQLNTIIHKVWGGETQTSCPQADDGALHQAAPDTWILIISSMKLLQCRGRNADHLSSLQENLICKLKEFFLEAEIRQCLFEYHVAKAAWLLLSNAEDSTEIEDCLKAEIRQCLFEYHVAKAAWLLLSNAEDSTEIEDCLKVASSLLSKTPSCLKTCTGDSVLERDILPSVVTRLYPVICFRILLQRECQRVLRQARTDPQLLIVLLHMYASLMTLHCHQPITDQRLDLTSGDEQIVNFEFLQSSLALVQGVIQQSSRQNLATVDVATLADTDPELANMIQQRL
ncbi:Fanconi anemia group A protein homolog isoform X2 [Asterias amurensis]|uniref:Fanconi anemia group A protein homolog isoform X2 n=1 Tax=Asterias amurensis TaxID=7602 RepID=UPI003AB4617B